MGMTVDVAAPGTFRDGLLVVFATQTATPLGGAAAELDAQLGSRLRRLVADGVVTGAAGEARLLHLNGEPARLAAAGLGPTAEIDTDAIRTAAAAVAREPARGSNVGWLLEPALPLAPAEQAQAIAEGLVLGAYDPGLWKTNGKPVLPIERLVLLTDEGERLAEAARRAARIAEWANRARDLANMPPNELTPTLLAGRAAEIAAQGEHVTAEAHGPDEIQALGMGAFAGVAQGSHNPPRLIVMRYDPPQPARPDIRLGLVGKAITFDSGGISIKPALYMEDLKGDMAGGGAVIAAVGALADLNVPLRVLAVVAATENMVGGGSFRPGDILRAANGKTIEVTNTDAEGRLVLADALWYAREQGATHLLDVATLTGAMELALGDFYAGVFGDPPAWRNEVVAAGEASGDHAWPWPLHARYRRYIESSFADMKNHSILKQGSPALAAMFLQEFAGEGPWAHIDMSGPAFLSRSRGDYLSQRGGTGYGVRLIVELARRLANEARRQASPAENAEHFRQK
jgi:leucyl aminopeptidase